MPRRRGNAVCVLLALLALVVVSHARARGAGRDEGGWIGASAARVGTVASRRGGDVCDARGGGETMACGRGGEG